MGFSSRTAWREVMAKYSAACVFLIVLLSVAVSGYMVFEDRGKQQFKRRPPPPVTHTLLKHTIISPEDRQQVAITEQTLEKLIQHPFPTQSSANITALAIPPVKKAVRKAAVLPTVSMVYISTTERCAVVDNQFVREGDSLPNGTRVAQIQAGAVQILINNASHWIKVIPGST